MAKHRAIRPNEISPRVQHAAFLVFAFGLILSLLAVFVTDGSRAYAEHQGNIPEDHDTCKQTLVLPSTAVMQYDNSERPRPNTFVAKVKSTPTCAISGQYIVLNEYNEVMSVIVVKPFATRAKFTLYPGSGTSFIAVPDERTYSATPRAVILGSNIALDTSTSNMMTVLFSRIGAKP